VAPFHSTNLWLARAACGSQSYWVMFTRFGMVFGRQGSGDARWRALGLDLWLLLPMLATGGCRDSVWVCGLASMLGALALAVAGVLTLGAQARS